MSVINKVIVTSRLEDGNDIDVSVKAQDRPLSAKDRAELDSRIKHSIVPNISETLYLKVRLQSGTMGRNKDNWNKLHTIDDLNEVLDKIFK